MMVKNPLTALADAAELPVFAEGPSGHVTPLVSVAALSRQSTQTLTEQLAERFACRIRDRLLAPGARLPSVRQCAAQHGLSPSTVVAAYDLLLAQGLVQAQRNRGFFVRQRQGAAVQNRSPEEGADAVAGGPRLGLSVGAPFNAATLIRGMFHLPGERPQPGMGAFPPDWMETAFLHAAVRRVTAAKSLDDISLRYGEPLGDTQLRRVLASRLQG